MLFVPDGINDGLFATVAELAPFRNCQPRQRRILIEVDAVNVAAAEAARALVADQILPDGDRATHAFYLLKFFSARDGQAKRLRPAQGKRAGCADHDLGVDVALALPTLAQDAVRQAH